MLIKMFCLHIVYIPANTAHSGSLILNTSDVANAIILKINKKNKRVIHSQDSSWRINYYQIVISRNSLAAIIQFYIGTERDDMRSSEKKARNDTGAH